ncbi:MAG: NAD-dependent epimerase/dehydratase [Fibrobacteres bacterium]|nr:NAD-dependent epimerase/dehydratase [Fibrobacterota bacterium]
MKALVTGAKGFIAGYLIQDLLEHGWDVVGLDNGSKYGSVDKSYDGHPRYSFVQGDAKDVPLLKKLLEDCDHFVAGAAMIGGISYFHAYAYDLLAENERITSGSFDGAIWAHKHARLKKITVISSSMVFENATLFPTPEGHEKKCPPPFSTYGFQKLATEYFALGAWQQYQLPFTILRPFNCVGTGEKRALGGHEVKSGNVSLAMTHVVPDLVQKVLKGQDPLRILGSGDQVRHYTYGGDLARGIRLAMESDKARNQDFNLSTAASTTVLDLAKMVWKKIKGDKPFSFESDAPFAHDVQMRVPDVRKAREVLGYEAVTPLETALDEIIPWIERQIELGGM